MRGSSCYSQEAHSISASDGMKLALLPDVFMLMCAMNMAGTEARLMKLGSAGSLDLAVKGQDRTAEDSAAHKVT